jgi:hypothetical protein
MGISTRFVFVCIGLVAISLMFVGTSHAKLSGAVAIYLLDDGSGKVASDSSGNGNDGSLIGDPKWVDGKFGKALSLSGQADYVVIPDSDSLDPKDAITLLAWVYPTNLTNGVEGIIAKWGFSGGDYRSYLLATSDTNNGVRFQLSPDGTGAKEKVLFSTIGLEMNKWTHIACTYDGSIMRAYFNGVEQGNMAYNQGIFAGTSKVDIGTLNEDPGANRVFDGMIDDVGILNIALTKDQISNIMNTGLGDTVASVSSLDKLAKTWGNIKSQL